jgi:hypothetical protein
MITFSAAWAAAGLNPYAYKLEYGGQSDENRKMTLHYWLNAPATSVSVSISYEDDGMPKIKTVKGTVAEGKNSVVVSTAGIPANTPISWSVTVNKASNTEPVQISKTYNFYCPQGVAVDKDPMSNNFGRILVTETLQGRIGTINYAKSNTSYALIGAPSVTVTLYDENGNVMNDETITASLRSSGTTTTGAANSNNMMYVTVNLK